MSNPHPVSIVGQVLEVAEHVQFGREFEPLLDTTIQDVLSDIQLNICVGYLLSSPLHFTMDWQNKQIVECLVPTVSTVIPNKLSDRFIVVHNSSSDSRLQLDNFNPCNTRSCIANAGHGKLSARLAPDL